MARPIKSGLDYFPFDVDFFDDDKLQFVSARFGTKGEIIAIKLLCKIYKENGYFYNWGDDESLLFAKRVGNDCSHTLVNDVVNELIKRGFFNKDMYDSFKILTSNGIQKRYTQIVQNSKLKRPKIEISYKLGVNSEVLPENSEESLKNSEESTQSKVKESKVKKSVGAPADYFDKNIEDRKKIFKDILKPFVKDYGKEMMREFYDYWIQTATPDRMYFEVQNDFYPNIRLENWKRVGAKSMQQQTIDGPKMKEL